MSGGVPGGRVRTDVSNVSASRETKEREQEMYGDFHAAQDRTLRRQEFADMVAERQRHARPEGKPSLRARLARQLFTLAVATEREETWRVVWERLEARRQSYRRSAISKNVEAESRRPNLRMEVHE